MGPQLRLECPGRPAVALCVPDQPPQQRSSITSMWCVPGRRPPEAQTHQQDHRTSLSTESGFVYKKFSLVERNFERSKHSNRRKKTFSHCASKLKMDFIYFTSLGLSAGLYKVLYSFLMSVHRFISTSSFYARSSFSYTY